MQTNIDNISEQDAWGDRWGCCGAASLV